jgi:hypothetical protein
MPWCHLLHFGANWLLKTKKNFTGERCWWTPQAASVMNMAISCLHESAVVRAAGRPHWEWSPNFRLSWLVFLLFHRAMMDVLLVWETVLGVRNYVFSGDWTGWALGDGIQCVWSRFLGLPPCLVSCLVVNMLTLIADSWEGRFRSMAVRGFGVDWEGEGLVDVVKMHRDGPTWIS